MHTKSTTNHSGDLDELARQIKSWRERYPDKHIPRCYWTRVMQLTEHLPADIVASRTGIDPSYLRRKLSRASSSLASGTPSACEPAQFIEVSIEASQNVPNLAPPTSMRLRSPKGLQIDLAFPGGTAEALPFVKELLLGGL